MCGAGVRAVRFAGDATDDEDDEVVALSEEASDADFEGVAADDAPRFDGVRTGGGEGKDAAAAVDSVLEEEEEEVPVA